MQSDFLKATDERVLVLDGAMGTSVHARHLTLDDYEGHENCTEILCKTRPEVVEEIHASFLEAGCDAVETNTFGSNRIVLAEFGLENEVHRLNEQAARIARRACEQYSTQDKPRFVIGSMGPGTKLVSLRQTTFEALEASYAEQVKGLLAGGVDALLIETCQDILQPKAAIAGAEIAFAEMNRRVPIMVQLTMETTGTMLVGTDIAAALTTLEAYPQIEVIGLNCATGPEQMAEHVHYLSEHCRRRISVLPNAGMPQVVDGQPHYPLSPEQLAKWLVEFVDDAGVNIVGGCCGTTPEHLAAVASAVQGKKATRAEPTFEPSVSSIYQSVSLRQDQSFLIIGERTNANGSRKFRDLLGNEDYEGMVEVAKAQARAGSHVIDVCAAYVGRDELTDMSRLISRLATEVPVPLMIDSTEPPVIEACLKLAGGKNIVNSINLEDGEERCEQILPLCKKYGAAVVALTIDEQGMAKTAERKVEIAGRLYELATKRYGIPPSDILFDPLTFTICTGNQEDRRLGLETLEAIREIKNRWPESHIVLGVSNISFGIKGPARHVLNSVFLHYAREAGLDAAIVHAAGIEPLYRIEEQKREVARRLVFDDRTSDFDPLGELLHLFADEDTHKTEKAEAPATIEEKLKQRIINGNRNELETDINEAMKTHPPLEIINNILLPGMKVVGDLFGSGQMQLPFVLQSAETMKAAVALLEPHMEHTEESASGSIVLATVKGDVHDIGKNLVDILLTNNGYTVYNIGIKQPINSIIDAWQAHKADAIGLSGLLVKSTIVMRDDLQVLNERGLTPPVILGGAALTRKYVEDDLRSIYKGPLHYAKDAFDGLDLMASICESADEIENHSTQSPSEPAAPAQTASSQPSDAAIRTERSDIAIDNPIPPMPFAGTRIVEDIPLRDALSYINEVALFQMQWQFKRQGKSKEEFEQYVQAEIRPIFDELVDRCEREQILQPRAIYGYWPCQSEGNDLIVYDPENQEAEIQRFTFPRQTKPPYWCLSDFWRPKSTGEMDVIACSIVTMGPRVSEVEREWFQKNEYRDYLFLHGLGVEGAESLAEYIHCRIRQEWGIADEDASELRKIFQQGYRGSRYSFGYPACPNVEDQAKLWPMLQPERIGVTLAEEFQMHPEQTTSAVITHHPEAKYFNV